MVPLPVAVIAVDACLMLAGAVNGTAVFETDIELILRVCIGAVRAAVAEECHRVAACCLEPEGEGVVLRGGAAEIALVEVDAVGGAVEFRTHALRQRPRGGVEQSRCALTLVVERGARAFVHRIAVHQSGFVAAEALEAHLVQFGRTEHLVPQACFEHIAHIGIAHVLARRVGRAEAEAARLQVGGNGVAVGGERLVALVESEAVRAGIEGGGQLREALEEQLLIGGDDSGVFAQNNGLQAVVAGEAQCEVPVIARVAEERHVAVRSLGIGQQLDGEVLVGEVALHVGSGVGAAVEVERGALRDFAAVEIARHVEVVHLAQIVAGDVFAEYNLDVVGCRKHAVGRLRVAEGCGAARILHTREDRRGRGDEARAVAAVGHGAEVVELLRGIGLAEEARADVAVCAEHLLRAAGSGVERGVGVVAANVHPVLLGLVGEFVLQFDVVETALVDVILVNAHGQVIASVFLRRLGVHHPLVFRRSDIDFARRRHKVCGDCGLAVHRGIAARYYLQCEVVVVKVLPCPNFKRAVGSLSGRYHHGIAISNSFAVNQHFRALGVVGEIEVEAHLVRVGHFRLVGEAQVEDGGLVDWHIAHAALLHVDYGFLDLLGALVDDSRTIVIDGFVLIFIRAAGSAAERAEYDAGVIFGVLVDITHVAVVAAIAFHGIYKFVKLRTVDCPTILHKTLKSVFLNRHAQHINGKIGTPVRTQGVTNAALAGFAITAIGGISKTY